VTGKHRRPDDAPPDAEYAVAGPADFDSPATLPVGTSSSTSATGGARLNGGDGSPFPGRQVFYEDLRTMSAMCEISPSGCWLAPSNAPVSCRALGDCRDVRDLPALAPHRWNWMVANGYAANPLPGKVLQVKRRCSGTTCCNPDHLFPGAPNGSELSAIQVAELANAPASSRAEVKGHPRGSNVIQQSEPTAGGADVVGAVDVVRHAQTGPSVPPPRDVIATQAPAAVDLTADSRANPHRIRHGYAMWIAETSPVLKDVATALALAVHPWPEFSLDQCVVDAIVAELLPIANLRHPDVCEVGIDRLLRLVAAVSEQGRPELACRYQDAAEAINRAAPRATETAAYPLVADPLGLGPLSAPRQENNGDNTGMIASAFGSQDELIVSVESVGPLLLNILIAGTDDLGVMLGGQSLGIALHAIVRQCAELEVLNHLGDHLRSLSDRSRQIVIERNLSLEPSPTLDALGQRFGVTRERIRQVSTKEIDTITECYGAQLQELSSSVLAPLRKKLVPTARLLDALRSLIDSSDESTPAIIALLNSESSWTHEHGWSFTTSQTGLLAASVDALLENADGYGSVAVDDVQHYLLDHFLRPDDLEAYVSEQLGWVVVGNRWSLRGSKRNRVATALRAIGRPATKGEIATAAGIKEAGQISSILGTIPDVVRADKDRWAFAGWVDDPYDGIVREIEQRIDEYGGAAPLAILLDEIPSQFGVSESSVRTYIATDAFVAERGLVRRNTEEYEAREPSRQSNAVYVDGSWGQRVHVHDRHFLGYSIAVSFDVAFANGIRPGDNLLLPVVGRDDYASVIWQRHNPSRTIHVGRLSHALTDIGCSVGDEIVVVPESQRVRLLTDFVRKSVSPALIENELDVAFPPVSNAHARAASSDPGSPTAAVNDPLFHLLGDD
jgi:hypothetical protein